VADTDVARRAFMQKAVAALARVPALVALLDHLPEDAHEKILMLTERGALSDTALAEFEQALGMATEARAGYKIRGYFPDTGPYRRELYPKHMALIAAGQIHRERCFLAGNRVGKTDLGAYEMTCHLTGLYPHWWNGRRFEHPIEAWAGGETSVTCRDITQEKLLGEIRNPDKLGTGMPRATRSITTAGRDTRPMPSIARG
jgi:hypothetical protein